MNVHAKKILQIHRCSSQFFWGGGKHVQKNADMSSPLAAELPWWTSAEPDELAPIITEVKNGENDGSRAGQNMPRFLAVEVCNKNSTVDGLMITIQHSGSKNR